MTDAQAEMISPSKSNSIKPVVELKNLRKVLVIRKS